MQMSEPTETAFVPPTWEATFVYDVPLSVERQTSPSKPVTAKSAPVWSRVNPPMEFDAMIPVARVQTPLLRRYAP